MSSKWITILEAVAFCVTALLYFIVSIKGNNTKGNKWAQILLIYANIVVFWISKRLSTAIFFVFVAAVVIFNLNKAKKNERRNKGYSS